MDAPLPGRSYTRADLVGRGFATALVNDLESHLDPGHIWGTTRTLFWSIITFGLFPAIWWPIKFREQVSSDRKLVSRLSDWIRAHCSHSESALLRNADEEISSPAILAFIPFLICAGLVYFGVHLHNTVPPGKPESLTQVTELLSQTFWYRLGERHTVLKDILRDLKARHFTLFALWNVGLCIAYLCHGIQVKSHRANMSRYLSRVNRVLKSEGLTPVQIIPARPSTGIFWLLGIGCLWYMSAVWGIVAMLAGAGQYRYITRTSPAIRSALSRSMAEISMRAPSPVAIIARCPRERCRAVVRPGAHFCGRCGGVLQA